MKPTAGVLLSLLVSVGCASESARVGPDPRNAFFEEDALLFSGYDLSSIVDVAISDIGDVAIIDQLHESMLWQRASHVVEVGRRGEGPGEFSRPVAVHFVGSELLVIDGGTDRALLFGPDGELVDELALPRIRAGLGFRVLELDDGLVFAETAFDLTGLRPDSVSSIEVTTANGSLRVRDGGTQATCVNCAEDLATCVRLQSNSRGDSLLLWRGDGPRRLILRKELEYESRRETRRRAAAEAAHLRWPGAIDALMVQAPRSWIPQGRRWSTGPAEGVRDVVVGPRDGSFYLIRASADEVTPFAVPAEGGLWSAHGWAVELRFDPYDVPSLYRGRIREAG